MQKKFLLFPEGSYYNRLQRKYAVHTKPLLMLESFSAGGVGDREILEGRRFVIIIF